MATALEIPCCLICYLKENDIRQSMAQLWLDASKNVMDNYPGMSSDVEVANPRNGSQYFKVLRRFYNEFAGIPIPIIHVGYYQVTALPITNPDYKEASAGRLLENGDILEIFYTQTSSVDAQTVMDRLINDSLVKVVEEGQYKDLKNTIFSRTLIIQDSSICIIWPVQDKSPESVLIALPDDPSLDTIVENLEMKRQELKGTRLVVIHDLHKIKPDGCSCNYLKIHDVVSKLEPVLGTVGRLVFGFFIKPQDGADVGYERAMVNVGLSDTQRDSVFWSDLAVQRNGQLVINSLDG